MSDRRCRIGTCDEVKLRLPQVKIIASKHPLYFYMYTSMTQLHTLTTDLNHGANSIHQRFQCGCQELGEWGLTFLIKKCTFFQASLNEFGNDKPPPLWSRHIRP